MYCELDMPPHVLIGAESRTKVADEALKLGFTRVLLVCDPFWAVGEYLPQIEQTLRRAGLSVSVHAGVTAEPDTGIVECALLHLKAEKCDGIIALGGGSVIDTAKTAAVAATNDRAIAELMGLENVGRRGIGVIAVPTTAGTGSEGTKVVVITEPKSHAKMTGRSRYYVPSAAILDHELTMTMPQALTAATGIDALTHAIEAYVSKRACDLTERLALNAVRLIWPAIRRAWQDGTDDKARRDMLTGSFLAGLAFSNASVGLVHSMSEPLGAQFGVPHGLSNAMLLPAVTRLYAESSAARYASIARAAGVAEGSADDQRCCRALAEALVELNRDLEIPSPRAFGIDRASYESRIERMATDAANAESTAQSPVVPGSEQIRELYLAAYDPGGA